MIQWMCERLSRSISNRIEWLNGLTKSNKFESVLFCLALSISLFHLILHSKFDRGKRANGSSKQSTIHFNQFVYTLWLIQITQVSKSKYDFWQCLSQPPSPPQPKVIMLLCSIYHQILSFIFLHFSVLRLEWSGAGWRTGRQLNNVVTWMCAIENQCVCAAVSEWVSVWPMKLFSNDSNKML